MKRIYLDYNSSQPLRHDVLKTMLPYLQDYYGNASSQHAYGQQAKIAIETSRKSLAKSLGCITREVIFTPGGTAANNLAIQGIYSNQYLRGHIVSTAIEHSSVLNCCRHFEECGGTVSYVKPGKNGIVTPSDIESAIRPDTLLITVMLANNETGMIQPIDDISQIAQKFGIHFHVDAVQAFGKMKIENAVSAADSLSVSAHKMGGPKGIGALYLKSGTTISPIIFGGAQEQHYWPGTENVAAIAGFGKACELLNKNVTKEIEHSKKITTYLETRLKALAAAVHINNPGQQRLPNTLSVSLPCLESDTLVVELDQRGVAVSGGAACASTAVGPSHVLQAMGLKKEYVYSSIRISTGIETTFNDIDDAINAIEHIVKDNK